MSESDSGEEDRREGHIWLLLDALTFVSLAFFVGVFVLSGWGLEIIEESIHEYRESTARAVIDASWRVSIAIVVAALVNGIGRRRK